MGRETSNNQIWQRASALTYTTILSLFPLLMVLSSVASVFYTEEQEEQLISWVTEQFSPANPSVLEEFLGRGADNGKPTNDQLATEIKVKDTAVAIAEGNAVAPMPAAEDFATAIRDMSTSFRSAAGGLGFAGILGLFITTLLLYKSIEQAFEAAWETSHVSSLTRTVTGFTFLVVIAPVILGLSITLSSFVVTILGGTAPAAASLLSSTPTAASTPVVIAEEGAAVEPEVVPEPEPVGPPTGIRRYLLMLVPAIFNSLILAAAYSYFPQANVQWRYALLGGFIAGFLWEAAKLLFFAYIFMSTANRAMLQSVGVLPIFLIWIYFTWLLFLVGNQVVYVSQNFLRLRLHHFGPSTRTYLDGRLLVAITMLVADAFERGKGGIEHDELGMLLRVPPREFDRAMGILTKHQLIELTQDGRYTLRRPADRIQVDALLNLGCDPISVCVRKGLVDHPAVSRALAGIQDQILGVGRGRSLRDLLNARRESTDSVAKPAADLPQSIPVGGKV
jgi:membrane protein